jgi:hypothetical protein
VKNKVHEAKEIIELLLDETTYPAWAGDDCRACDGDSHHAVDCPWQIAIVRAGDFLEARSD